MDGLFVLAREYVRARIAHSKGAQDALRRVIQQVQQAASGGDVEQDGWADRAIVGEDGVALTCRCEDPDGVIRYRRRMPTAVSLERAEIRLRAGLEAEAEDSELRRTVSAVFEDDREPFYSWRVDAAGQPLDWAEKQRADDRLRRYSDVFQRLQTIVSRMEGSWLN